MCPYSGKMMNFSNDITISISVPSEPEVAAESSLNKKRQLNLFDEVIQKRVLPQDALSLCSCLLSDSTTHLTDAKSVVAAWRQTFCADRRRWNDEDVEVEDQFPDDGYYPDFPSFMSKQFHAGPEAGTMWIPSLTRDADWLKTKCGMTNQFPISTATPNEAKQLLEYLEEAKALIGVTGIDGYILTSNKEEEKRVADSKERRNKASGRGSRRYGMSRFGQDVSKPRKTCRAQFSLIPHTELAASGSSLSYHPDYVRALKFVSTLQGRVHTWFEPWITACALRLAKTGLTSFHATEVAIELAGSVENFQTKYPITTVTLAMMVSEWSARKEFTLESQKQGALNEHLVQLLELAKTSEADAMKMIALVYPLPEIYRMISKEACTDIYQKWMSWAKLLGLFLNDQWNSGVWKSARRQMRVLPRGSGVNSAGFNAAADAWSNMCRYARVAVSVGEIKGAPLFLKTLQLIANDQFRWGQAAGKGVHSDAAVFDSLTRTSRSADGILDVGVLPWMTVLDPSKFDTMTVLTRLSKACADNDVDLDAWLGLPKVRTEATKVHVDMICGVTVPSMSSETADWLKNLGLFGAGVWEGK